MEESMPKFVIIPNKQQGFTQYLPIQNLPGCLYTGSLHYNFKTKYEALPNIDKKLQELSLVITNGNKCFVGLKYDPSLEAPIIVLRGSDVARIQKYCAENCIYMVKSNRLAAKLFRCNSDEFIPEECYEKVAGIIIDMNNEKELSLCE